jgi:four helix bundle protein
MADIRDHRQLRVYIEAREAAVRIYSLSQDFPEEEKFSLTSQIRRSSRSVCANLAEGWQKRRYPASFRAKVVDAAGEADETRAWLDIAVQCGFVVPAESEELEERYDKILGHLIRMATRPEEWRIR